mgnify:CR=1 FL=1
MLQSVHWYYGELTENCKPFPNSVAVFFKAANRLGAQFPGNILDTDQAGSLLSASSTLHWGASQMRL